MTEAGFFGDDIYVVLDVSEGMKGLIEGTKKALLDAIELCPDANNLSLTTCDKVVTVKQELVPVRSLKGRSLEKCISKIYAHGPGDVWKAIFSSLASDKSVHDEDRSTIILVITSDVRTCTQCEKESRDVRKEIDESPDISLHIVQIGDEHCWYRDYGVASCPKSVRELYDERYHRVSKEGLCSRIGDVFNRRRVHLVRH